MDETQESTSCTIGSHKSSSSVTDSRPASATQCDGVPERRTLLRTSESQGLQLLGVLQSFREQGLLFDFTLKVQEHSFSCHRCVLAACSDFFRSVGRSVYLLHLSVCLGS